MKSESAALPQARGTERPPPRYTRTPPGPAPEPLQLLLRPLTTGVICTMFMPRACRSGNFGAERLQNSTSSLALALEKFSFPQSGFLFFQEEVAFCSRVCHLFLFPKDLQVTTLCTSSVDGLHHPNHAQHLRTLRIKSSSRMYIFQHPEDGGEQELRTPFCSWGC